MLTVPLLGRIDVDPAKLPGMSPLLRLIGGESETELYREIPSTAADWSGRLDGYRVNGNGAWDVGRIEAAFARVKPRLEGVRILLAPGYLADFFDLARMVGLSDYLEAQLAALRGAGLEVEHAPVNSQGSIADNAEILRREVTDSPQPVIVISHSKGGIDTLEFLLGADDELRAKVVGWLAIQAPFAGTPIADRVAELGPLRHLSEMLLWALGGTGASLHDHRSDARAAYMAQHDEAIRALTRQLPFLAVASALDRTEEAGDQLSPTYPSMLWMREQGIRSDGVLPTNGSILPHAPYVLFSPVDHIAMVAGAVNALAYEDRVLVTKLLVTLLMDAEA